MYIHLPTKKKIKRWFEGLGSSIEIIQNTYVEDPIIKARLTKKRFTRLNTWQDG